MRINIKRLFAAAFCSVLFIGTAASCGKDVDLSENPGASVTNTAIVNYTKPEVGEKIVILKIKDKGEVKIKLFPQQAEKGVENFVQLAEKGYYDELIFHRIIKNFMIQGGDPMGTGSGGESVWGGKFDGGTSPELIHCAGAVAYANNGGTQSNGSQFYIVTGEKYTDEKLNQIEKTYQRTFPKQAREIYKEEGGAAFLDGNYTVFGQVFEGLDIVMEVQNVATGANDRPYEAVVIESVRTEIYGG